MSILNNSKKETVDLGTVLSEVATIISDQRDGLVTADTAKAVMDMQSLGGAQLEQAQSDFTHAAEYLASTGLSDIMRDQMPEGVKAEASIESAAILLMASGDPAAYQHNALKRASAPAGTVIVENNNALPEMTEEAFDNTNFSKFNAMSVVVTALSLAQTNFDELFFPTEIIAAGNSGVTANVSIPYAFNRTKRAADGAPYKFEKNTLINACEDHTILESRAIDLVPNGQGATNNAYLADPAIVANRTVTVDKVDIQTRPLAFGVETDILAVSAISGLIGTDGQDETDALDPNVALDSVYVRITNDNGGTPIVNVVKLDMTGLPGVTFTRQSTGSTQESYVAFNGSLSLTSEMLNNAGASINALDITTILGIPVATPWGISLPVNITGTLNTEYANATVFGNSIAIGNANINATHDSVAVTSPEYLQLVADVTFEFIGYELKARRINSNIRVNGIYVDNSEVNKYFFPVEAGAPISSVKPLTPAGDAGAASVKGIVSAIRTRTSNTAITTLMDAEKRIQYMEGSTNKFTNASTIGSLFVRPKYMFETLDVQAKITIRTSDGGFDDLRALLVDKITRMADRLALDSGYLTALESFVGSDREYKLIIGTDPILGGLLMRSGDERTFGNIKNFEIRTSLDLRMRGKIYFSFARVNQKGIDPLSFGCHLLAPSMIHEVANSPRGGAIVQEVQVMPVQNHYNTLPVLARLDITKLEEFYSV